MIAMALEKHRKATVAQHSEAIHVTAVEQTYHPDVSVSVMLFVLMVAIALHVPISGEIGDDSMHRPGFFMHAFDLMLNFGLGIGMSLLLFSRRAGRRRDGASR